MLDKEYKQSLKKGMEKINNNRGTAVGFHSVLDGFIKLNQKKLDKILSNLEIEEIILKENLPQEIQNVNDFIRGLFFSLKNGKAAQLMIRDEATFKCLQESVGYDELRLGGTSANMSSILSQIGLPRVIVYANPLTRELAELFPNNDNLYVFTRKDDIIKLEHPALAWKDEGVFAVHWIFDFPAGLEVNVGDVTFTTPRANRFIAAWNPINNKLQLDPVFVEGVLEKSEQISHFLLSGYHIISEKYPDGTSYSDYILPTIDFVQKLKRANEAMKIHVEFASISSSVIRKFLITKLLPQVDSVGMNEIELASLMNDLGEDEIAANIMNDKIEGFFAGGYKLIRKTGIRRFHGHNLGYYLLISQKDYAAKETAKEALFFAANLAAARTKDGYLTKDNWRSGLEVAIREKDLTEIHKLGKYLLNNGYKNSMDMVWENDQVYVIAIPTRVVDNPVLTVGLGDTISASAFLTS